MRVRAIAATELALGVGESWNGLRRTSNPPIAGASEARSKNPPFSASPYFSMVKSIVRCAARRYLDRRSLHRHPAAPARQRLDHPANRAAPARQCDAQNRSLRSTLLPTCGRPFLAQTLRIPDAVNLPELYVPRDKR